MSRPDPVPKIPLRDDPTEDSIWKRYLERLGYYLTASSQIPHNSLAGLQGGVSTEYYHLTSTQHATVTSFSSLTPNRVVITLPTGGLTTNDGFQVSASLAAPSWIYANFSTFSSSGAFVALTAENFNVNSSSGTHTVFGSVYSVTHDTTLPTTGGLRGSFARVQSTSSATGSVAAISPLFARLDWNSSANVSTAIGVELSVTLDGPSFINHLIGYNCPAVGNLGGATVQTNVGFNVSTHTVGNQLYGFRGQIAASSTRFNLFMDGTAQNAIVGNTKFGASTAPVAKMDVTGDGLFSSTLRVNNIIQSSTTVFLIPDGRVYGTTLHNNANPVTGTSSQWIASGTYTPTISSIANLDAVTSFKAQWIRVGNVVNVSGKVQIDPTTPATLTILGFSLPIASNLANQEDCAGTAFATGIAGQGAGIRAEATNDQAEMAYISGDVTVQPMQYIYQYEIL